MGRYATVRSNPTTQRVSYGRRGFSGNQDLSEVQKGCRDSRTMWEDPEFPADDRSLFFSKKPTQSVLWKRPSEIVSRPQLSVAGIKRLDVNEGELGDSSFIAALSSLEDKLIRKIVPDDQSFDRRNGYCGVFRFKFWHFGQWVDVLVDDRLPTIDGKLMFAYSLEKTEFWVPLLEKAYAKFFGCYEALNAVSVTAAMEDFTGGIVNSIEWDQKCPNGFEKFIQRATKRSTMMACSIKVAPNKTDVKLGNGLEVGQVYILLTLKKINVYGKMVTLVLLRNSKRSEAEWNGAWSDGSNEWRHVSDGDKRKIGLTFSDDGEFWMSFEDFEKNFQLLEACFFGLSGYFFDSEGSSKTDWSKNTEEGVWKKNFSAGGSEKHKDTFHTNPQFHLKIDHDESDDTDDAMIVASLMQNDVSRKAKGLDLPSIGYSIFKLTEECAEPLDAAFFEQNTAVKTTSYISEREVCENFTLPIGHYVLIPSTEQQNAEAEFFIRIFTDRPAKSREMDESLSLKAPRDSSDRRRVGASRQELRRQRPVEVPVRLNERTRDGRPTFAVDDTDSYGLQNVLDQYFENENEKSFKFKIETLKSMVAFMDVDMTGKLEPRAIKGLFENIKLWKDSFDNYGDEKTGTITSRQFRSCLKQLGLSVSNSVIYCLLARYQNEDGVVTFEDFILAVLRLRNVTESFKAHEQDRDGNVSVSCDQLLIIGLWT